MFPENEKQKERAQVIKDFCCPTGVSMTEIDLSTFDEETLTSLNKVLHSEQKSEEDTFVFTINGNDYEGGKVFEDDFLNCLCLKS